MSHLFTRSELYGLDDAIVAACNSPHDNGHEIDRLQAHFVLACKASGYCDSQIVAEAEERRRLATAKAAVNQLNGWKLPHPATYRGAQ